VKVLLLGGAGLAAGALAVLSLGAAALTAALPHTRGAAPPAAAQPAAAAGVPRRLVSIYRAAATTFCPALPWTLLAAQGRVESGYRPRAVSPAGALGIAQFMPGTWTTWRIDGDHDGITDPFNPADAIPAQARYDCALLAAVRGIPGPRIPLMLAAYNAGPGAVQHHHGIPPYAETRTYITAVLAAATAIEATPREEPA
jgi:soluble lytic murein transglycosylase-like protein